MTLTERIYVFSQCACLLHEIHQGYITRYSIKERQRTYRKINRKKKTQRFIYVGKLSGAMSEHFAPECCLCTLYGTTRKLLSSCVIKT